MVPSRFPPFQERLLQKRENLDRFIPNRSAIDFDYAHYMLTTKISKEKSVPSSPSSEAYRKLLEKTFNMNRPRILAFKNKAHTPMKFIPSFDDVPTPKPRRHIPQTPERTLEAPDLVDDYYLNLLDWGSNNILSIALENSVYLWDASNGSISELVTINEEMGLVTSVKFAPDGRHIVVGLNNSQVQLWDWAANRLLRTLKGGHVSRVGAMEYRNNHILTTGGMDGQMFNNDVRVRSHIVETYRRGHHEEVRIIRLLLKLLLGALSSPTYWRRVEVMGALRCGTLTRALA